MLRSAPAETSLRMVPWLIVLVVPFPVHAQLGFEALLSKTDAISLHWECWAAENLRHPCTLESGYGVEISFDVGEVHLWGTHRRDQIWKPKTGTRRLGPAGLTADSIIQYEIIDTTIHQGGYLNLDLALGYGEFNTFGARGASVDIRGKVREIPAVTVYVDLVFSDTSPAGLYTGVRSGLIQLHNARAYLPSSDPDAERAFSGAGQAFQFGIPLGIWFSPKDRVTLFGEAALMLRQFTSVEWNPLEGQNRTIPILLPKSIDFSGASAAIGLQFRIR